MNWLSLDLEGNIYRVRINKGVLEVQDFDFEAIYSLCALVGIGEVGKENAALISLEEIIKTTPPVDRAQILKEAVDELSNPKLFILNPSFINSASAAVASSLFLDDEIMKAGARSPYLPEITQEYLAASSRDLRVLYMLAGNEKLCVKAALLLIQSSGKKNRMQHRLSQRNDLPYIVEKEILKDTIFFVRQELAKNTKNLKTLKFLALYEDPKIRKEVLKNPYSSKEIKEIAERPYTGPQINDAKDVFDLFDALKKRDKLL